MTPENEKPENMDPLKARNEKEFQAIIDAPLKVPTTGTEFFRPELATWWLYLGLVGTCSVLLFTRTAPAFRVASEALWILLPFFLLTTVLFSKLILAFDPYRARRPWVFCAALLLGATVPTYLSARANGLLVPAAVAALPTGVGADWASAIVAPVTEEITKGLCIALLFALAQLTMRRLNHALLLGSFVGLGFQIFENITYAANLGIEDANSTLGGAIPVALFRTLTGVSTHWVFSAIVGVGLALLWDRTIVARPYLQRWLQGAFLLLLGPALHALWNAPAGTGLLAVLLTVLKLAVIFACLLAVARMVIREEQLYVDAAGQMTDEDWEQIQRRETLPHRAVLAPAIRAARAPRWVQRRTMAQALAVLQGQPEAPAPKVDDSHTGRTYTGALRAVEDVRFQVPPIVPEEPLSSKEAQEMKTFIREARRRYLEFLQTIEWAESTWTLRVRTAISREHRYRKVKPVE